MLIILWTAALLIAAFAVASMLALVLIRVIADRVRSSREARRQALLMSMLSWLDGAKSREEMHAELKQNRGIATSLLIEIFELVRGEDQSRLAALAEEAKLPRHLRETIEIGRADERKAAAESLVWFPSDETRAILVFALSDRDPEVSLAAAASLAQLGERLPIRPFLESRMRQSVESSRQLEAVLATVALQQQEDLLDLARDPAIPDRLRAGAIDALGRSGSFAVIEPLAALAESASAAIRAAVCRALGSLGHPGAEPAVRRCLADPEWDVRAEADGGGRTDRPCGHHGAPRRPPRRRELVGSLPGRDGAGGAGGCRHGDAARGRPTQCGRVRPDGGSHPRRTGDGVTWLTPEAIIEATLRVIVVTVILTGLAQNVLAMVQLVLAGGELARNKPERRLGLLWRRYAELSPPIALLVPAYNEELSIVDSLRSMLALNYPRFEIIAVNDGSRDGTLRAMIDGFGLEPVVRSFDEAVRHKPIRGLYGSPRYPMLLVVDKENGGKSDALNAGINLSRAPIFCAIDADSILESDALLRAARPFIEEPTRTVAVGGTIRIANGCKVENGRVVRIGLPANLLALFQTIEYLRAFLMARLAWSRLKALMIVSGAFGLFRRQVAVAVGGYSHSTVGEDFDLVVKIHRYMRDRGEDYAVTFIPEPVCWTEAPESLRVLGRQRSRWQRGALETFWRHADMLLRPRYGRIGALGFLHVLIVDVLGPPVEVLGYLLIPLLWFAGLLSVEYLLAFLALTFVYGVFISVGSLILEEIELARFPRASDLAVLTFAAVLENFGYRQLNNVWRLRGYWQYLRGAQGWGTMTRVGFRKA